MFTLAHLSDPHLAPLPAPRWSELTASADRLLNWQRKRRFVHDPGVLAQIVADLKAQAPDHIAVTGDIANIALPAEFARRDWLDASAARDVTFDAGQPRRLCARSRRSHAQAAWGATHARRRRQRRLSIRAAARAGGAGRG